MCGVRFNAFVTSVLLLHLGGCMTWKPVPVNPRLFIEDSRPQSVRVWSGPTEPIVISHPSVERGSIVVADGACRGIGQGRYRRYVCPTRPIIAIDDVRRIEVRRMAPGRSLLILSPFLAVLAYAAAFEASR